MKKETLFFTVLLMGLLLLPCQKANAWESCGDMWGENETLSGNNQDKSFWGSSLPSETTYESFSSDNPLLRAPGGSGGIDTGEGGTTDPDDNRNDAPVGTGVWTLLFCAAIYVGIKQRKRLKKEENCKGKAADGYLESKRIQC